MNDVSKGRENRRHRRVDLDCPLLLKLIGGSAVTQSLQPVQAVTRNISEGGLFIDLGKTRVAPGESITAENFLLLRAQLDMEIQLGDGNTPVKAMGRAIWVEKPVDGTEYLHGMAVQFVKIADQDRQRIATLVAATSEAD